MRRGVDIINFDVSKVSDTVLRDIFMGKLKKYDLYVDTHPAEKSVSGNGYQ